MSKIEQPLLALDANVHYSGFRTRPVRRRGMRMPVKAVLLVIVIATSAIGVRLLIHGF